ncbi:gastrula zinc finger protein XlCGF53.1-like [Ranitomeya imitator]|uniref:gastrula zinc finger protein XlCGF53.1-like n=1 Tax=Ranitomeya imitator TaxID=111125 RepID=UPI0037E7D03B
MERDKIAEQMLHLTLEILFRLTGEDYIVVKKTSSERCQDPVSEGWGRPLSPITGRQPRHLLHEDINDQKILELTYKMIELLTGEVPIRCQDVSVYFSMEEWEYLEGHKDLYKDIMMEAPQPFISPVLSSKRTTPERCPRLLPQDCKQENLDVPLDHQGEDLTHDNTIETYVRGVEWCKEEIPTYGYPVLSSKRTTPERCPLPLLPQDCKQENIDVPQNHQDEDLNQINTTETYVRGDEWCKEEFPTYDYPVPSSKRTTPERCFRPLLPQDCKQEDLDVPLDHQDEDMTHDNTIENYLRGDERCKEEIPTYDYPVLSSKRTTPERCPRPLLPQDCKQENLDVPQDHQDENLTHINTIETYVRGVEWCKEEIPTYDYPGEYIRSPKRRVRSSDFKLFDDEITQDEAHVSIPHLPSALQSEDLSSDRFQQVLSPYSLPKNKNNRKNVEHERSPKEENPCLQSGKNSEDALNLVKPEKSRTKANGFSCSDMRHEGSHTGVKPFACSESEKCFARKADLVGHQRIHTREKPFLCTECGKCYSQESHFVKHLERHTRPEPYPCSECGKRFSKKSILICHQRSHMGEKPFLCSECGRRFSQNSHLTAHLKFHAADKPYYCLECKNHFKLKSDLVTHQQLTHGISCFDAQNLESVLTKKSGCATPHRFSRESHLVDHNYFQTGNTSY